MGEYSDAIDQTFGQPQRQARISGVSSIDDNPDDAARAHQLGQATGVDPSIVYGDVESFDKNHKAALTAQLIENNPHLQDYINSHPLAAKISNDDWGQLDTVSEKLKHFEDTTFLGSLKNFGKGMNKEFEKGGVGQWIVDQPGGAEFAAAHPASFVAWQILGAPIEVPMRMLNAFIEGGATSVGRAATAVTGSEDLGKSIEERLPQIAGQYFVGRMSGQIKPLHVTAHNMKLEVAKQETMLTDIKELSEKVKPYTDAGEVPPVGIDPRIDKWHSEQARADVKALDEADKEFQKTATLERSPEMAANFAKLIADRDIGISADAIRALYGDKQPHPEDGILGHIEGFEEKLRAAEATGGDVDIPLPDWLAHVDPEVKKELRDDVRVRQGGLTLNEVKELGEQKKALEPLAEEEPKTEEPIVHTPEELVRSSAALKPLFEEGPTKQLRLQYLFRGDKDISRTESLKEAGIHYFKITDEKGTSVGDFHITEQHEGLDLHINWIGGDARILNAKGGVDNVFGPKLIRGLFKQLKAEFPKAEFISGERVSGAREAAGKGGQQVRIPLKAFSEENIVDLGELLKEGKWVDFDTSASGLIPTEAWTVNEKKIISAVDRLFNRILPERAEVQPVRKIEKTTETGRVTNPRGMFFQYEDRAPVILFSINSADPLGTGRHEAIHWLRREGFFTPDEWDTLQKAAISEGWIDKHQIRERYKGLGVADHLEEAIAEEYKTWGRTNETPVDKVFQKLADLLKQIKTAIADVLGHEPTAEELFQKVESGEVAKREGTKPLDPRAFQAAEEEPQLPGITRQEDLDIFAKANAIGMTADQYKRYIKLIEKRNAEDTQAQLARNLADEKRRQTKEWKTAAAKMVEEIRPEIEGRPDVALGNFFRNGILYGEDTHKRPKLDPASLTKEQKAVVPENYLSEKGGHPDDYAGLFGLHSGDAVIDSLAKFENDRQGLTYGKYLDKVVDAEVEKRMKREHGDLGENILKKAQEHVLGQTQMDMLHEETVALGMQAGLEMPFTKADIHSAVKDSFASYKAGAVKVDKFLAEAGKAGRAAEVALLKGDPAEAFRQRQRQYYSALLAKETVKFEKEMKRFERTAKTFSKREVLGVLPEYTNFIHDILIRVGEPVRRSIQDLEAAKSDAGYKDLLSFVQAKENETWGMREVPVADFLFDESFRKPVKELTIEEFRGLKQSIDTLNHHGRDEKKLIAQGVEAERADILAEMKEKLKTFPLKDYPANETLTQRMMNLPKTYLAAGTSNETLLNRWDRNDPRGVFNKYLVYPLAEAANHKARLDRETSAPYRALGKIKDPGKLVESPFNDPLKIDDANPEGRPWTSFSRNNVMAMVQNWGNDGNRTVLAKGYKSDVDFLHQWLEKNTTVEDWDRAQKLGDIFGDLFEKSEVVYRNITGVAPERIDLVPFTMHGKTYPGWYHPLIKDPLREGPSKAQRGGGVYDDTDYGHATIANGYIKRRTGAVYPLDLNFDMVPVRISQMIHDIAFRQVVIQAEKIYNDTGFRTEVTKHYGSHYTDGLMPYLKGVAGAESINSKAAATGARVSEFLRQNVIGAYIGFNPYTALKHGPTAWVLSMKQVGPMNFLKAFASMYSKSEDITKSNREFAIENSEELQRRERHWNETIAGQHKDVYGEGTLREKILEKGSWLVAQSDMISAAPTWLAQYNKSIREGMDHGAAVDEGNRAVRQAHGSTAVTNLPALVRGGGALHGWLTTLFGFFGTMLQRRIEIAHKINDAYKLGREGELKRAAAATPDIATSLFVYYVFPTMVEEYVTGLTTDDKRGLGTHLLTGAALGLGSSFIYIRDIIHSLATGQEPGVGLISSPLHDIKKLTTDLGKGKKMLSKENAGQLVGDAITVFGEATGMAPKIVGNAAKFGINIGLGREHPKTFKDWRMGVTRGTTKQHVVK